MSGADADAVDEAQAVGEMLRGMRGHLGLADAQRDGCSAIGDEARRCAKMHEGALQAESIEVVLRAMEMHPADLEVQLYGFRAVWRLVREETADVQDRLLCQNGAELLLHALTVVAEEWSRTPSQKEHQKKA
eukprot:11631069-Prorocentrum_lima.AAC.1